MQEKQPKARTGAEDTLGISQVLLESKIPGARLIGQLQKIGSTVENPLEAVDQQEALIRRSSMAEILHAIGYCRQLLLQAQLLDGALTTYAAARMERNMEQHNSRRN